MAIKKHLEDDNKAADEAKKAVCQNLFKVDKDHKTCAVHFYNILGKSALGMLKNMGDAASSKDTSIAEALVDAQPHIKYEILKNLDWKIKVSNGKKEMVSTDQWLERLEQDSRAGIKSLASDYKIYLGANSTVKNILNKMVMDINNNTRLLDEKYKEAIEQPQPPIRRRKLRLSATQISDLRTRNLSDNVTLNAL